MSEQGGQQSSELLEVAERPSVSSVELKVNAKGEVQPTVKVYGTEDCVEQVQRAVDTANKALSDLMQAHGWPGRGPRAVR